MMANRWILFVLLAVLAWAAPMVARAQNCTVTVTGVAFGTYDPVSATPRDANGSIVVECVLAQIPVDITLDAGNNAGGNILNRRMVSGTYNLPYQLYTDAARSVVWGNGTSGTTVTCTTGITSGVCTGSSAVFGIFQRATRPVYGRIPTAQDVGVGSYSDSVDVTITF